MSRSLKKELLVYREKTSTGSALAESEFIAEGAIGKTVGLSYRTEANL